MKFKITGHHRRFFDMNGFVEFENFFSPDDIDSLSESIDHLLIKRIDGFSQSTPPEKLFLFGRDLWRSDPKIALFVSLKKSADVATQLFNPPSFNQRGVRLAFDQLFETTSSTTFSPYLPIPLQAASCIRPLAGFILLHLTGEPREAPFFPKKRENIVFVAPHALVKWENFFERPFQRFFIVAYAPVQAHYLLEKNDPHTHSLKRLGYAFGDLLTSEHHPLVYRFSC